MLQLELLLFQAVAVLQEHRQQPALVLVVLLLQRRETHLLKHRREIRENHFAKAAADGTVRGGGSSQVSDKVVLRKG
jgi:hypothetical protein